MNSFKTWKKGSCDGSGREGRWGCVEAASATTGPFSAGPPGSTDIKMGSDDLRTGRPSPRIWPRPKRQEPHKNPIDVSRFCAGRSAMQRREPGSAQTIGPPQPGKRGEREREKREGGQHQQQQRTSRNHSVAAGGWWKRSMPHAAAAPTAAAPATAARAPEHGITAAGPTVSPRCSLKSNQEGEPRERK